MAKRDTWSNRVAFILAAVGSAVGLGNAWRFPGLAAKHGGGAFLLVYIVAMLIIGIPLLMMEVSIGRKTKQGAPNALRALNKKAEPIGWAATANAFVIVCYYSVVFAWVLSMVVGSFFMGGMSPEEASGFFLNQVIQTTGTVVGDYGIPWWMLLALLGAWMLMYYCIRNGTSSVGKVAYFTVSAPVILLLILAIKGISLEGSAEGLAVFFIPDFSALADITLWVDAFGQVFYSISIMMAIMIAYGSFLKDHTNVAIDCIVISVFDLLISVLSGVVMFSTMYGLGLQEKITSSGIVTAFVVYPLAFSQLTSIPMLNSIFACLFYLALSTLAVDSAFSIVEGVATAVADKFGLPKKKTVIGTCIVAGIVSVLFITKAGLAWLDIVDNWCNMVNLLLIGVMECIAVGWMFDVKKVLSEVNRNTNKFKMPSWWFNTAVRFVAPVVLAFLFTFNLIHTFNGYANGETYGGYPLWAECIAGWAVSFLIIVSGFIIKLVERKSKRAQEAAKNLKSWDEIPPVVIAEDAE